MKSITKKKMLILIFFWIVYVFHSVDIVFFNLLDAHYIMFFKINFSIFERYTRYCDCLTDLFFLLFVCFVFCFCYALIVNFILSLGIISYKILDIILYLL